MILSMLNIFASWPISSSDFIETSCEKSPSDMRSAFTVTSFIGPVMELLMMIPRTTVITSARIIALINIEPDCATDSSTSLMSALK